MKFSQLASRYAKAAYELAVDSRTQDKVLSDLRFLDEVFNKDPETNAFLVNPNVKTFERVSILEKALADKGLAKETYELVLLLARKGRFALFSQIVHAYEFQADLANGICRGTVRSAVALSSEERTRVEATVEKVLKKKVIMTYKADSSIIGGLTAEVGSYTFDDSISSHLRRMNEELKRRTV